MFLYACKQSTHCCFILFCYLCHFEGNANWCCDERCEHCAGDLAVEHLLESTEGLLPPVIERAERSNPSSLVGQTDRNCVLGARLKGLSVVIHLENSVEQNSDLLHRCRRLVVLHQETVILVDVDPPILEKLRGHSDDSTALVVPGRLGI